MYQTAVTYSQPLSYRHEKNSTPHNTHRLLRWCLADHRCKKRQLQIPEKRS